VRSKKLLEIRGGASDVIEIDWRFFLAGGLCAAASHGITTPIDVVKTKMQTNPEKYKSGVVSAAKEIINSEGVGVLLAGLGMRLIFINLDIVSLESDIDNVL
jgi:Mitochondrial carrier protein